MSLRTLIIAILFLAAGASPSFAFQHMYLEAQEARSHIHLDGYRDFCYRYPWYCAKWNGPTSVQFTPELLRKIQAVQARVTNAMEFKSDLEVHGVLERWSLFPMTPGKWYQGDCEDAVLAKKYLLMRAGVPAGALRLLMVKVPREMRSNPDENHLVLNVVTDIGDLILDIHPDRDGHGTVNWVHEFSYEHIIARTDGRDPTKWVPVTVVERDFTASTAR